MRSLVLWFWEKIWVLWRLWVGLCGVFLMCFLCCFWDGLIFAMFFMFIFWYIVCLLGVCCQIFVMNVYLMHNMFHETVQFGNKHAILYHVSGNTVSVLINFLFLYLYFFLLVFNHFLSIFRLFDNVLQCDFILSDEWERGGTTDWNHWKCLQ